MDLFENILKNREVVNSCIHLIDADGLNPLLKLVKFFAENFHNEEQKILR